MPAERKERNPARVVKIYDKAAFTGTDTVYPGDYKLSDGRILSSSDDEQAQINFAKSGYNKGKAKDLRKNLASNVEKSIPHTSRASEFYEPTDKEIWRQWGNAGDR